MYIIGYNFGKGGTFEFLHLASYLRHHEGRPTSPFENHDTRHFDFSSAKNIGCSTTATDTCEKLYLCNGCSAANFYMLTIKQFALKQILVLSGAVLSKCNFAMEITVLGCLATK